MERSTRERDLYDLVQTYWNLLERNVMTTIHVDVCSYQKSSANDSTISHATLKQYMPRLGLTSDIYIYIIGATEHLDTLLCCY